MNNGNDSNGKDTDNSRRRFFGAAGGALGVVVLAAPLARFAHADDLPHLPTTDPTAQALKYTEDASTAGPPEPQIPPLPRCGIATAAKALLTLAAAVSTATSHPVSVSPNTT